MNIPDDLLDDLEEFIENFVDGAPDASSTSKEANDLSRRITAVRDEN